MTIPGRCRPRSESCDRSHAFLTPEIRLSMTEASLGRVVSELRALLTAAIDARRSRQVKARESARRPVTCQAESTSLRVRESSTPARPATNSRKLRDVGLTCVVNPQDVFLSSSELAQRAVCFPSFLVQAPTRSLSQSRASGHTLGDIEMARLCSSNPSIMHRLNLKLTSPLRPGMSTVAHVAATGGDDEEPNKPETDLDVLIAKLRVKIRQVRVAEERLIRDLHYNPKQLLSDFALHGMKARRGCHIKPPTALVDPSKELIVLIEQIDAQLSTNEALAVLKELGIDYQPRSAMGKKNVMATDLSAVLAPNGFKLISKETPAVVQTPPEAPSRENHQPHVTIEEEVVVDTNRTTSDP